MTYNPYDQEEHCQMIEWALDDWMDRKLHADTALRVIYSLMCPAKVLASELAWAEGVVLKRAEKRLDQCDLGEHYCNEKRVCLYCGVKT